MSVRVNEWQRADQKGLASVININKVGNCKELFDKAEASAEAKRIKP